MKKYLLLALLPLLYACSDSPSHRRGVNYDEVFAKDTQGLDILTGQFSHNIDRSDWKKLSEKGKESQSGLLSAVKYWYDPMSPEQIGLAQPVKNLLTQFVRNYYG